MQLAFVLRTLGVLLTIFSASLIPPAAVSLWYHDGELPHLASSITMALAIGLGLWWPYRHRQPVLRRRDGFVIVAMMWIVTGLICSLPFVFGVHLSFSDAVFESISAFTTTGATVIVGLDALPPSILFYRQELQWLGGIGVVVSAIAILPMLGIGGMQLYRAETPGPMKDEKLTPRITHTARALLVIYLALTGACAFAYDVAGMSTFDAVAHSLATVSTGGFSTHDASIAHFNSVAIELIAGLFMLLGAINFSVHFLAYGSRDPMAYWRNTEVRVFLLVVAALIGITAVSLYATEFYSSFATALRFAFFQVISVITSTGFTTTDFSLWPLYLPALLIFSSFMGGCAGSTAGGMKVIRFMILARQGQRDVSRLIHPRVERPLMLGGRVIDKRISDAVWGFFAAYVAVFVVLMLLLMADGMDQVTAFGAVATCLNNLGPGLGQVSTNFVGVSNEAEWLLSGAMLLGRLEIFTILVLLTPAFWRE